MDFEVSASDYIKQNLMSIRSELMRTVAIYPTELKNDTGFSEFITNAIQNVTDNIADDIKQESEPAWMDINYPSPLPLSSTISNIPSLVTPTANQVIQNYSNTKQLTGNNDYTQLQEIESSYKSQFKPVNPTPNNTITDEAFYNSSSLNPQQIDKILKEKDSPFAERTYSNGRTAGQLIYDACNKAGTESTGPKTINPALVLAIMGAESNFGKDPKNVPENPFNIKIGGRFDRITNFEDSLKIAVNTMYNWAQAKPENKNVSLFDFAGNKYCEDYTKVWKPNVEGFYSQFLNTLG